MEDIIGKTFFDELGKALAINQEERKKPKLLKTLIGEFVEYIETYINDVFSQEFWGKKYRIRGWDIINDIPRLKEQLLNDAWFQDIERNDELYINDKTNEIDYENKHANLENDYKLAINLSLDLFLSYLEHYPQIRRIDVEFEVKASKSTKAIIKKLRQAKLNQFINLK